MIYWNSFSDFLAMGGYGFYVWGSFGATALLMVVEPILTMRRHQTTIARLKRQLRAEARGDGAKLTPSEKFSSSSVSTTSTEAV